MEQQTRLVRDFSLLRLPHLPLPPNHQKAHSSTPSSAPASFSGGGPLWTRPLSAASGSVSERSAPAVVPRASYSSYSDRLRPYAMEGLVQDFNTALDETAGSHSSERSTGRRKAWKRRCKSTSNLVHAVNHNLSEDSSSSLDNFGLLSRDRGTSSLQLSDSDLDGFPRASRRNRLGGTARVHDHRKRGMLDNLAVESDSFTENISPFKEFRINSKRKRKSKRMAVDSSCENVKQPLCQTSFVFRSPGQGTKRKKVRSRSGCEGSFSKKVGIIPGKRKRSTREKSSDSHTTEKLRDKEVDKMELEEEVRSSSSLSSSECDDIGSDLSLGDNDGREADDEQSDWPGPEPGVSLMQLTDEEIDPDITFNYPVNRMGPLTRGRSFSSRQIKSGTRRLRGVDKSAAANAATSGVVGAGSSGSSGLETGRKPTHTEVVCRFLQDHAMRSVRIPLSRASDRSLVLSLAALHSLSWRQEAETSIILSKTCQAFASPGGEFAVPGIPRTKDRKKFEPKRQKKAPPLTPVGVDAMQAETTDVSIARGQASRTTSPVGLEAGTMTGAVTRQRCKSGSKSS